MGEKLPRVTADEIIRVLKKAGFIKVDQSGSHQKWYNFKTGKQTTAFRRSLTRPA